MELLPTYYVVTVVGVSGLIIGSFLDVLVTRFHTGKSINGRSRCMSCGHTLSWYELLPLLSYIALRGRCKNCEGHIPLRLLCMELLTAASFLFAYAYAPSLLLFVFSVALLSVLIVVAVYDMRHMVIPNLFVMILCGFAVVYLGYEFYLSWSVALLLSHVGAAFGASAFYALLWVVSKGKWIGLGDAKLAIPLGLMLSIEGAFSFVVLSFWIGAGISLFLLGLQKVLRSGQQHLPFIVQSLTMKSEVPFAPFVILAFVIVFLTNVSVLSIMAAFL